jgi:hypothetical protein
MIGHSKHNGKLLLSAMISIQLKKSRLMMMMMMMSQQDDDDVEVFFVRSNERRFKTRSPVDFHGFLFLFPPFLEERS